VSYAVKEIFFTLQGEGANAGRPAVFCRFSGCNLWSGREADRETAICQFCDTDFVGMDGTNGGRYQTADQLASTIAASWPSDDVGTHRRFVVCTGGEPLLQLDEPLIAALHDRNFAVAVETNGTQAVPPGLDWVCVSPKAGSQMIVSEGSELKLVFPQGGAHPSQFEHLEFGRLYLQPMDGLDQDENTQLALQYCLDHPRWSLSIQTHKLLGIR
jgi:7-carboxy-7-deazaguanine synthase